MNRICKCWKTIRKDNISWKCIKCVSVKHWLSWTLFYTIFRHIRQRCKYKHNVSYKYYWGKWIKCERNNFNEFIVDMYESYKLFKENNPSLKPSIERIDNNWNYCRDNCKWIDRSDQSKNRKWNRYITYNWETDTIWWRAKRIWLNRVSLLWRLNRWRSIEKAIWQIQKRKKKSIIIEWKEFLVNDIMHILWVWETTAYRYIRDQQPETIKAIWEIVCK